MLPYPWPFPLSAVEGRGLVKNIAGGGNLARPEYS